MIEIAKIYSIDICLANPDKLYVFGENERQKGYKTMGGGQAIIRGCPNAFGFCTLQDIGDYWTDDEFLLNKARIEADIAELKQGYRKFNTIVFPKYGLGTGRARMIKSCPRTFLYMCDRLLEEFDYNNIEYLSVPKF